MTEVLEASKIQLWIQLLHNNIFCACVIEVVRVGDWGKICFLRHRTLNFSMPVFHNILLRNLYIWGINYSWFFIWIPCKILSISISSLSCIMYVLYGNCSSFYWSCNCFSFLLVRNVKVSFYNSHPNFFHVQKPEEKPF